MAPQTLGIAIIGSGIFVKDEHLPAVQHCQYLSLKAIYSRSIKSAQAVAQQLKADDGDVAVYSDDEPNGMSYSRLLEREDIHGVIVALPIPVQPEFIKQALKAGKHVLAEKPLAKDVSTGKALVEWYHTNVDTSKVTFGVAEQFRYRKGLLKGAELISQSGKILSCRLSFQFMIRGNKYSETQWRQKPEYQGGFVLDGGVHFVAGLRVLLRAGGVNIKRVSAYTSQLQDSLPPLDTVDAALLLDNGSTGTVSISFGTTSSAHEYIIACSNGSISVLSDHIMQTSTTAGHAPVKIPAPDDGLSVRDEVQAWAASLLSGKQESQQRPEEALADLELVEAMLWSGENGGAGCDLRFQI